MGASILYAHYPKNRQKNPVKIVIFGHFSPQMYFFELGFEESARFLISSQIFSSFALWNVPFMKNLTFCSFFDLRNRRFFSDMAISEAFRTIFNHPCHRSLLLCYKSLSLQHRSSTGSPRKLSPDDFCMTPLYKSYKPKFPWRSCFRPIQNRRSHIFDYF